MKRGTRATHHTRRGFLVSAARNSDGVYHVEVQPRRDNQCRLMNPWPGEPVVVHEVGKAEPVAVEIDKSNGECLVFSTVAGHKYVVESRTGGTGWLRAGILPVKQRQGLDERTEQ